VKEKKKNKLQELMYSDPLKQDPNVRVNAGEVVDNLHGGENWEKNLLESIERGKKNIKDTFYIAVHFKYEKLIEQLTRDYWFVRRSCPTPTFDQVVYKYDKVKGLQFLWTLPSREDCYAYKNNMLFVPDERKDVLRYVLDFFDGNLDELCMRENKEQGKPGDMVRILVPKKEGAIHA
jgi:hypothetical protein